RVEPAVRQAVPRRGRPGHLAAHGAGRTRPGHPHRRPGGAARPGSSARRGTGAAAAARPVPDPAARHEDDDLGLRPGLRYWPLAPLARLGAPQATPSLVATYSNGARRVLPGCRAATRAAGPRDRADRRAEP